MTNKLTHNDHIILTVFISSNILNPYLRFPILERLITVLLVYILVLYCRIYIIFLWFWYQPSQFVFNFQSPLDKRQKYCNTGTYQIPSNMSESSVARWLSG